MTKVELPKKLEQVFRPQYSRYRGARGGRGSAKSWGFAIMAAVRAYERRRRILCARELQNSIKDSVHKLLCEQIVRLELPGFQLGDSFIRHANGSEFLFRGLRTNAAEIKSMEGIDLCWVEEAQKVSEDSWDLLVPTIRAPGSEIWVTFNPDLKTDATSQKFIENPPPDSIIVEMNYNDNPWFPEALRKEMLFDKKTNYKKYLHVWEGQYKDPNEGGRVCSTFTEANVDEGIVYDPDRRIYLTCDFNVDPMCWGIAHIVTVGGKREYRFFDEVARENTTIRDSALAFARKYAKHKAGIIVTGDANSGRSRSDTIDAVGRTRWDALTQALSDYGCQNVQRDVNRSNPEIQARLEVWNKLVCDSDYLRRVKVSPNCKRIIHSMYHVRYIPGQDVVFTPTPKMIEKDPKMKWNRNDMVDAVSYLTWKYDPIVKEPAKQKNRPRTIPYRARA